MIEIPLLTSEDIEVKIKQVTKSGALALLYKTARVDRRILNEVFGVLNWTNDYKVVKDNLYCGIGIRENADQPFIWRWDCGIESRSDNEGNEKKGEASDAFKRCAFAIGIGEELYSAPMIWLNVNTVQSGGKWVLEDPYAKYVITHIDYNKETRVITELEISNAKTNTKVFSWKLPTTGAIAKKMVNTVSDSNEDQSTASVTAPETKQDKKSTTSSTDETLSLKSLISGIGKMVKNMNAQKGSILEYNEIVKDVTGEPGFKCNAATEDQYDLVLAIYQKLIAGGYNN